MNQHSSPWSNQLFCLDTWVAISSELFFSLVSGELCSACSKAEGPLLSCAIIDQDVNTPLETFVGVDPSAENLVITGVFLKS